MKYLLEEAWLQFVYVCEDIGLVRLTRTGGIIIERWMIAVVCIGLLLLAIIGGIVWRATSNVARVEATESSQATEAETNYPTSDITPSVSPTFDKPTETPAAQSAGCNSNYSPCVPNSSHDLNCADIGFPVTVVGSDQYGLDRDGDGTGCDSY